MNTAKEILLAAAALIEQPGQWTQGTSARDARGRRVSPNNMGAVSWCAMGALNKCCWRVTGSDDAPEGLDAYNRLAALMPGGSVGVFNDTLGRTAAEVAAKMREAAA